MTIQIIIKVNVSLSVRSFRDMLILAIDEFMDKIGLTCYRDDDDNFIVSIHDYFHYQRRLKPYTINKFELRTQWNDIYQEENEQTDKEIYADFIISHMLTDEMRCKQCSKLITEGIGCENTECPEHYDKCPICHQFGYAQHGDECVNECAKKRLIDIIQRTNQ